MFPTIHRIRSYLGEQKTKILRRTGYLKRDWKSGLSDEAAFWVRALAHEGRDWNRTEYQERMDPNLPLQPELRELIDAAEGTTVRILDVGAGPLTRVGRVWPGRTIEIMAVDPLAEEYRSVIARLGLTVPVTTQPAEGERLREKFAEDTFDLAYASNCLDHAYDPAKAIREMLAVVKPGKFVYLWHFRNCGVHERYQGLHQWNFSERDGDMKMDDGYQTTLLSEALEGFGAVECTSDFAFDFPVVIARVRKLASPPCAVVSSP